MGKKVKLKPKEMRFLEEYAKCGNHADAYLAAGYKVKSREVARTCGSRLLRRLDESMDYREILDAVGLTDRRLAEGLNILIDHKDARVRVQALALATKCKGWQLDRQEIPRGITVVINQQPLPPLPEEEERLNAIKPVKYHQITD